MHHRPQIGNPLRIVVIAMASLAVAAAPPSSADAALSAWMYVFGQFVDHDLSLESAPPSSAAIDIAVPRIRFGKISAITTHVTGASDIA